MKLITMPKETEKNPMLALGMNCVRFGHGEKKCAEMPGNVFFGMAASRKGKADEKTL